MFAKFLMRSVLSACAMTLSLPLLAQASGLPASIEQVLTKNNLSGQSLSLAAIPLTGPGRAIFYNADTAINPASTMKLVTTYSALELLGPAYQWKTELASDGILKDGVLQGNLYVKGGGDPKLTMEKLWLLLRDLKANGVTTVTGDLVLDNHYFSLPRLEPFDDDGSDQNKPFLVEPDSLLVNFKAMRIIALGQQQQVKVSVEPPIDNLTVVNQIKLLPPGKCQDPARVFYKTVEGEGKTELVMSGEIVSGCRSQSYVALLDHPQYVAGVIRSMWRELGGSIQGRDRVAPVVANSHVVARAYSADLTEVIRDVNKYSNNTMAKQVFLSIGAQHRTASDRDDAAAAKRMINQLMRHKKIPAQHLTIENGSGLSRNERVSARELAYMLKTAWESPFSAEFISSLPIAGMDGTLRNRMKNTAVRGKAHLKTGTLRNVRALAGYVRDKQNNQWALVAIINDDKPWSGGAVIDHAVVHLHQNP